MAAAAASKNIQLALALPARLRTFLARYPPSSILPAGANAEAQKTAYQEESSNPFLPMKHPVTGKWHDPKYSLRRQAELVKLARENGVEELLPHTPKGTEVRLRKRVELGLRVRGTGVGQKVKGHKHERRMGVKYVWIGTACCSGWLARIVGLRVADCLGSTQDGEEERRHAGDAGTHQGMEEGLSQTYWDVVLACLERVANFNCRLGKGTGPSFPNKRPEVNCGSYGVFRLYQYQCTTCPAAIRSLSHAAMAWQSARVLLGYGLIDAFCLPHYQPSLGSATVLEWAPGLLVVSGLSVASLPLLPPLYQANTAAYDLVTPSPWPSGRGPELSHGYKARDWLQLDSLSPIFRSSHLGSPDTITTQPSLQRASTI